jgi:hypothetical protein
MGIAPGLEGSSIQQNLVELGSARYEDITSQVAQPHPSVRINPHVSCQCECVCVFSRAMRVCVMAKLSGDVGAGRFWAHTVEELVSHARRGHIESTCPGLMSHGSWREPLAWCAVDVVHREFLGS